MLVYTAPGPCLGARQQNHEQDPRMQSGAHLQLFVKDAHRKKGTRTQPDEADMPSFLEVSGQEVGEAEPKEGVPTNGETPVTPSAPTTQTLRAYEPLFWRRGAAHRTNSLTHHGDT